MKTFIKNGVALGSGILGALYLLNLGAGIIELIPDNLPYVGNLDEATAVALLLYCIRHFRNRSREKSV